MHGDLMNDTERQFNAFVQKFGGVLVSDLVGASPGFKNADYLFDKYHVIAELKCLSEDKAMDPQFIEKTSKLHQEAFQHGGTRVVIFGTVRLSADNYTREYQERLIKLYEEPIRNAVKTANKQIRETKQHLGKNDYAGVLLVVNENNMELDPAHVAHLLGRILSRGVYSSINHAISLTVNLRAVHPSHDGEYAVWTDSSPPSTKDAVFQEFESALRQSWIKYQERKQGRHIPLLQVDDSFFRSLKNRRGS
jgi:hypothetical protein